MSEDELKAPLVTAVMITGKSAGRERLARLSVKAFLDQTYRRRELVIINHGEYALKIGHPTVREIMVPERKTLGELRNAGIVEAKGEWIIQWDDDDYHHPHRILYQMAHRRENWETAVLLRKQIRVDMINGEAICVNCDDGISGTILHSAKTEMRYPALDQTEDAAFAMSFRHRILLDNDSETWPGPALYLRFYHGDNVMDHAHIMVGKGSYERRWVPHHEEKAYISDVLRMYGIGVKW
jgi:glycosyltransferase involved in cell wall biosynthesis